MPVKVAPSLGWQRCAILSNGHVELTVTLDVGPRILDYRTVGGSNVLWINEAQAGKAGEPQFAVRGGHRLWAAPEGARTSEPDNGTTEHEIRAPHTLVVATPSKAPHHLRRELIISLTSDSSAVMIEHRVINESKEPLQAASWGLTIMTPGGYEIIPQPAFIPHGKTYLPQRVIVPWTYTDFADPRWRFGSRYFVLTPKAGAPSTKMGFSQRDPYVAWLGGGSLFLKSFTFDEGAQYPDLGCNYETFSKGDFLELETLSPFRTIAPGEAVSHTETWHLFQNLTLPERNDDDMILEKWLHPYLTKAGIL